MSIIYILFFQFLIELIFLSNIFFIILYKINIISNMIKINILILFFLINIPTLFNLHYDLSESKCFLEELQRNNVIIINYKIWSNKENIENGK